MKRLLLAPLLIAGLQSPANAFPFGDDIVVKNDFGEKTIVKKSTVSVEDQTVNDVKKILEYQYESDQKEKDSENFWLKKLEYCKEYYCTESTTKKYEENYKVNIESTKRTESEYKRLMPIFPKFEGTEIIRQYVFYQPIFQNINNRKSIGAEKKVSCRNPSPRLAVFFTTGSSNYLTALERKICDKYAKF